MAVWNRAVEGQAEGRDVNEAKMRAIVPGFGAKRKLVGQILAEVGPHNCWWDLFAFTLAVTLNKPACRTETVNDLYGDVINLARVVRDELLGPALYRRLRRTFFDERTFAEAAGTIQDDPYWRGSEPDLDRAYQYFVFGWMGRSGVIGTREVGQTFSVRYTNNGGHSAMRWCNAIDSIPAWRRRLRTVTILERNVFDLLPRIEDAPGTVIYCDPPYIEKGATYLYDFAGEDHPRLAEQLARFTRARVLVSYYDHPDLDTMYAPGRWTKRPLVAVKSLGSHKKGGGLVKAPEVLLINGPSLARPERMLFE